MSRPGSSTDRQPPIKGAERTETLDFAAAAPANPSDSTGEASSSGAPHDATKKPQVHYALGALNVDTSVGQGSLAPPRASDVSGAGFSPVLRRRFTRAMTFRTVEDFDGLQTRPGWQPGAEPGADPNRADGGHATMPRLSAHCDITVVDYSQKDIATRRLDNDSLVPFLKTRPPAGMKCRWINVNGLSWDVIKALGQYKNLHRLALEDLMNTRNRTKADW